MALWESVLESLAPLWRGAAAALPRVAAGLLLLVLGWIAAKVARRAALRGLKLARVDALAERAGVEDFLLQGGVPYTTVTLVAGALYWSVLAVFGLAALRLLGLEPAARLLDRIVLFVPNVLAAIFVVVIGAVFSRFVGGAVAASLNNVGIEGAELLGAVARGAMLVFVVSAALEQLSIGGQVLVSAFQIAFGALCLALALAFGLGGRDWASHVLERIWKR